MIGSVVRTSFVQTTQMAADGIAGERASTPGVGRRRRSSRRRMCVGRPRMCDGGGPSGGSGRCYRGWPAGATRGPVVRTAGSTDLRPDRPGTIHPTGNALPGPGACCSFSPLRLLSSSPSLLSEHRPRLLLRLTSLVVVVAAAGHPNRRTGAMQAIPARRHCTTSKTGATSTVRACFCCVAAHTLLLYLTPSPRLLSHIRN